MANAKVPFVDVLRLSPPLSCNTTVPVKPDIVPPMVNVVYSYAPAAPLLPVLRELPARS